jgi:hypothetical protein
MKKIYISALLVSSFMASSAYAGTTKPGQTLGYFLPKTDVVISVSQRIEQCPENGKALEVTSKLVIKPRVMAGQYVEIDIRSGLFAERTTAIKLRENGTLESFNAKTEGQGGKILGALTKVALTAISFGAGAPLPLTEGVPLAFGCNEKTRALLTELALREERADALESEIAQNGETSARLAMLERYDSQVEELKEALTLGTKVTIKDYSTGSEHLKSIVYSKWFQGKMPNDLALPGRYGFKISRDATNVPIEIMQGDGTTVEHDQATGKMKPLPALVYQRSVKVPIGIVPCADQWSERTADDGKKAFDCNDDESFAASALSDSARIPAPQLSGLFSLRVGNGGLFGTKEAKAEFDEFGTPILLSYGTTSGTDDAVSVIEGAMDGVKGVRDAKLSELERRIAIAKARKELAELQADDE